MMFVESSSGHLKDVYGQMLQKKFLAYSNSSDNQENKSHLTDKVLKHILVMNKLSFETKLTI